VEILCFFFLSSLPIIEKSQLLYSFALIIFSCSSLGTVYYAYKITKSDPTDPDISVLKKGYEKGEVRIDVTKFEVFCGIC